MGVNNETFNKIEQYYISKLKTKNVYFNNINHYNEK